MRFQTCLAAACLSVLPLAISVPPAHACGGLFCQRIPVEQAGERIIFAFDGQQVTTHVQIQYQGAAKDFSWIVPTPTKPTLRVGSEQLFQMLRDATQPRFQVNITKTLGECDETMMMTRGAVAARAPAPAAPVNVVSEAPVGPFDTAVLQANDSSALKSWLTDNGYVLPEKIDPLLDPYVAGKYYFIALKLRKDREVGDMQPIAFTYAATKPGIPIRLTGVAATPDMGVYVWLFAQHRAVPDNFKHAEINEARIDWTSGGGNYSEVVTEAMNEAGGQAFVTDYAGKSSIVEASRFDPAPLATFARELSETTDPVEFTRKVLGNGQYFLKQRPTIGIAPAPSFGGDRDQQMAFLRRHLPKPPALTNLTDDEFYYQIEDHRAVIQKAQLSINGPKVLKELEDTVVAPARDIQAMLKAHPYLTRLYTTMSPEEMTQDPTFVLNPDAGDVSNQHVATGTRLCSKAYNPMTAPVELTLKNGLKFIVQGGFLRGNTPLSSPAPMPAALRVEQFSTVGAAALISNVMPQVQSILGKMNAAIRADAAAAGSDIGAPGVGMGTLGPARPAGSAKSSGSGGFGCFGNPVRSSQGSSDDGLAFALFGAGFVGWRLTRRRKGS
ncbi:MAG: DUF2330 domain-containing protein [Candidatus Sericytochromatia bacterium]|nr:DUF2330 domain-containing protein [Candidatus Sericytochromatia bacterium]